MMVETKLEKIYEKVAPFIDGLCNRLSEGTITPADIPLTKLRSIIQDNFTSAASHIDLTKVFDENMDLLLVSLQNSISHNDIEVCIELMNILSQTLKSFVHNEINLLTERMYTNMNRELSDFSHRQYDVHMADKLKRNDLFSGKGVIYTAITGGYDSINDPEYVDPELKYICFTDNRNLHSDIWEVRVIDNPYKLDNIRLARRHKILCEEYVGDYDYSIWVDGKIRITGDMKCLIGLYHLEAPLLCVPHYERDCLYEEAAMCKQMGKSSAEAIDKQMSKYKKEGYPAHNGLVDTCVLFRAHKNTGLNNMLALWWDEVKNETPRDQLSFNYACYKANFDYDLCNLYVYENQYFRTVDHQ